MRIAIIGAGAAGLAAAYDLAGAGQDVTVYEAGAEVGGLAAGFKEPEWDWSLEKFYHHWFSSDADVLQLIAEIGHADKVIFKSPVTSLWHESGIYPMDAPTLGSATLSRVYNILRLPDISLQAKLRFGLAGVLLKMYPNGITLEKTTANRWLREWVGSEAHEMLWKPLLIGKFGPLWDRVNMAWMWARLYKRTAELGTYEGGFQQMLEDLAKAVEALGADIRLNTRVEGVEAETEGSGVSITVNGKAEHYDQVLFTASPQLLVRLVKGLSPRYAAQARTLESMGALAMVLVLDRQLMEGGTYWLNLPARSPEKSENPFPFLALVEHTNYVSSEHFNGEHIVYLGDYLPREHEHFNMSEEELAERFLPALKQVNPDFSPEWIKKRWLFRVPYAQPVPFVNHSRNIPDIRTSIDGLYFASMSQVYPWDRGTNYAVEMGRRTARMMLNDAGL